MVALRRFIPVEDVSPRRMLSEVEADAERRDRGVPLDEWRAAPPAPLTVEACEVRDASTPCPHLRCEFHIGFRGDRSFSCQLDFAALPDHERTYERIGEVLGISFQRVEQVDKGARSKIERTRSPRSLAPLVQIRKRHA
jgi:hypothetical protein